MDHKYGLTAHTGMRYEHAFLSQFTWHETKVRNQIEVYINGNENMSYRLTSSMVMLSKSYTDSRIVNEQGNVEALT